MKKRGLSPVIATVMLIAITVALFLIVFLWFKGMNQEAITKNGKNVQLVCEEIKFDASYSSGKLLIANNGNVAIFRMKMKVSGGGSSELKEISDGWPEKGLNPGMTFSKEISVEGDTIKLFPVLLGDTEEGEVSYTCENFDSGEITIN